MKITSSGAGYKRLRANIPFPDIHSMKNIGENVVRIEAEALRALADRIGGPMAAAFQRAVDLLFCCAGRVVVTHRRPPHQVVVEAPPPPHPAVLAAIARRARIGRAGIPRGGTCRGTVFCERGRMHSEMQANGQPYGRRSAEILFCSKAR